MKRHTLDRIAIGKDQLVVSVLDCGDVELRISHDINGLGIFMPTGQGFIVPHDRIGDLITALAAALKTEEA